MEILVLHPGALGDIILSLPALSLLRKQATPCRITLCGNLDHLGVVPRLCADRCRSLSTLPLQRLHGSLPIPEADIRFWTSFDRIVSWTGSSSVRFAHNLHTIHQNALVAPWKPVRGELRHVSRIFCDSLGAWIAPEEPLRPLGMAPRAAEQESAARWLRDREYSPDSPLIALHPGGGGSWKCWPIEHYVLLARRLLREQGGRLLIVEGPAEPGLGSRLQRDLASTCPVVAKCLPLNILLALLSRCAGYVGNDSGVSHLAAALGIPCVVVFGPTAPEQWKPLGLKVTVLKDASGCTACEEGLPDGHRCLSNISPDAVMNALISKMRR